MKKVLTLFAAVALLVSASFAQDVRRHVPMTKHERTVKVTPTAQLVQAQAKTLNVKAAGDTISNFPWEEGFETSANNWTFVTANPTLDNGFQILNSADYADYSHNGTGFLLGNYSDDIDVSQWAISPVITLPSDATNFTLSWYVQMTEYAGVMSSYEVRLATTTGDTSIFTTLLLSETGETDDYVLRTVSLAAYAGQSIRIAFHNKTGMEGDALFIDDIRIGGPEAPLVSIAGPATALLNQPTTYIATSTGSTLAWYVDGTLNNATGDTLTYTFTTEGSHQIVAEATNTVGSTSDTLNVTVVDCSNAISTFPHIEDFESGIPCWSMILGDNANPNAWGLFTDAAGIPGSTQDFRFNSYNRVTSGNYNQWLISPEFAPEANTDYILTFWYKAQNAGDKFKVLISSTTADTSAFTLLHDYTTPATAWTPESLSLPSNTKYIAFKYYGNYAYYLYIDNITYMEPGVPDVMVDGPASAGTGMPATYTVSTLMADSVAWYVDGNVYASDTNAITVTFTTAIQHEIVAEAINTYGSNYDTLLVDVFSCDNISLPYTPDFSTTFGCWYSESREQPSGWFLGAQETAIDGDIYSLSAQSYMGIMMVDIAHDNWFYSPEITMPITGNYEISWRVKPFTPSYASDHYGVYVISNNDTNLLFEETLDASMSEFVQRAAALNVTSDFRVAFRHFNSEGGYVIVIDSIELKELEAPAVILSAPTTVEQNVAATFTAIAPLAQSFAWTVDGAAQTETSATLTHTFTTAGTHTVSVTATNIVGSASASATIDVFGCPAITTFPWTEDFENESTLQCFRLIDADEDGYSWTLRHDEGFGNNGSYGAMMSASYINNIGALTPNNWMITPALTLPAEAVELSWYVKALDPNYAEDNYTVYITTGDGNIDDFTTILYTNDGICPEDWTMQVVDLSAYAGQTVRIAFRHHESEDVYQVLIDDLRVGGATAPVVRLNGPADVEKGRPATFTAVSGNADSFTWTVDGARQTATGNTLNYTFTSVGNHVVAVTGTNNIGTSQPVSQTVRVYSCDEPLLPLPWTESFEGSVDCWIFTSDDDGGFAVNGDYPNLAADGNNFLIGWTPTDANANQWAISMPFYLPANVTNAKLTWSVASNHRTATSIDYEVLVSTQGVNPDYFTTTLFSETASTNNANVNREASLASLAGKEFRIAFHNKTAAGGAYMILDNLKIASPTGIDNMSNINIAIYPNPVNDKLNIEGEGIQMVEMFDVNGRNVLTTLQAGQIDLSSLANGIYVVRVTAAEGICTKKIVKK